METTNKDDGSKSAQWRVDYEIPHEFEEIARKKGVKSYVLVSSINADPKSRFFYSRMKGELEEKIEALGFDQYIVFRPGLLKRPDSDRLIENISISVLNFFNSLGILQKQTPLTTPILAQKMVKAPKKLSDGVTRINLDKIFSF